MSPALSVVLLNWETRALLRRSLDAALASTAGFATELVVVDNGSTDGSAELVRDGYAGRASLVALARNHGPAHGFNVGMARATGRLVMLLNTDAFLTPDAVAALVGYLDAHDDCGVAVPRLLNEDGTTQRGVMRFPTRATLLAHDSILERLWPANPWRRRYFMEDFDHEHDRDVDQPPQAVMLVRREVLERVGPLDEMMPIYFNDVDWCRRIRDAGFRIRFLAGAPVVHLGGATARRLDHRWAHIFRDRIRYARKHFGPGGALLTKLSLRSLAWWEAARCLLRANRVEARRVFALVREVLAEA